MDERCCCRHRGSSPSSKVLRDGDGFGRGVMLHRPPPSSLEQPIVTSDPPNKHSPSYRPSLTLFGGPQAPITSLLPPRLNPLQSDRLTPDRCLYESNNRSKFLLLFEATTPHIEKRSNEDVLLIPPGHLRTFCRRGTFGRDSTSAPITMRHRPEA